MFTITVGAVAVFAITLLLSPETKGTVLVPQLTLVSEF